MASILGNNFVGTAPGLELVDQAIQVFNNGLAVAVSVADGNGNDTLDLPYAYLYYLLFDRSFNLIEDRSGARRVTSEGGF